MVIRHKYSYLLDYPVIQRLFLFCYQHHKKVNCFMMIQNQLWTIVTYQM